MARTAAGRALTEQHRTGQLQIRSRALQDYIRLWPLWRGDEPSFWRLVYASVPLVQVHRQLSSALSAAYFEAFRRAEGAEGSARAKIGPPLDESRFRGSMLVTGRNMTRDAILAGQSPQAAMQTSLVRTSGTISDAVLGGGRDTTVLSTGSDRQATGWARVTSGDPCAFCAVIASNGPVYHGEDTAEFEAHDGCGCTAEPSYEGSEWPGRAQEFKDLYNRVTGEARASGELARGTSNDLLNAFRRAYDG